MAFSFIRGQFVAVRDVKDGKVYRAKVVEVDDEKHSVKVHYVGWNATYDEVMWLSSSRVEKWQSSGATSATGGTLLNATAVPGGSKGSVARDSVRHLLLFNPSGTLLDSRNNQRNRPRTDSRVLGRLERVP